LTKIGAIKPGDLLKVMTTDDSLVKVGSYGLVEKTKGYGDEPDKLIVIFNYYAPPWWYSKDTISASGGPEFQIDVSKVRIGNVKKKVEFHIRKENAHFTSHAGVFMTGWTDATPVEVTVHEQFLDGKIRDDVQHINLEPKKKIDPATGLKILMQEVYDETGYPYKGRLDGPHWEISLAGNGDDLKKFAASKGMKPTLITDNGRVTRAYIESGNWPTLWYMNPNYPREEFPWRYKE
jgi:hypothetical protein